MGAEISKQLEEETQQQQQEQQKQLSPQQKQLSQQQQHQLSQQQQQQKQPLQQQEYNERRSGIKKLELMETPSPSSVPQNLQRSVSNRENSKKQADQRPNYGSKSLSPHDDHHQKVEKVLLTNSSFPQNSPNRSSSENYNKKAVVVKQASIPQNLQQILKDADSPIDTSSESNKLYEQLYSGVFLYHKSKKYWMDKKLNCNCFMLYARSLSITWGDTEMYWRWLSMEESSGSGTKIEVAELKAVCWLEVNGRLETKKLSPGILYQVSFHVMLNEVAFGWEVPINLRLVLLGGGNNNNNNKQEYRLNLRDKVRNVRSWTEIPVGKFVASSSPNDNEFLEFSLYEYEAGNWKQGLLIKGVSIKPAHSDHDFTIPL